MTGRTEPRIYTPPLRRLGRSTSLGYAMIDYAGAVLGITLYPWQEFALKHAFEIVGSLSGDWHFRFRTILFEVARQNGKTTLSKVIASFFLNILCVESVFGTSLSLEKAEETWAKVVAAQEGIRELSVDIDHVHKANGAKRLSLTGGRVYKVGAPTRRAGRGDSNDLVLIDELREHRDWEAWSAATASTSAKPNGIVICFSNAGDPDSVVLRQVRSQAIAKIRGGKAFDFGGNVDDDSLGLFEWSAPDEADLFNRRGWAMANPSMGYGFLTEAAILGNIRTMPENKFRSEHLCQMVETLLTEPFPRGSWAAGVDERSRISDASDIWYGIDLSHDRRWLTIAACGQREDGHYHIEVIARRNGIDWAEEWFRTRAPRGVMRLAFQSRGAPVSGVAEQICTIDGVERCALEGPELTNGWARFWDSIAASEPVPEGGEQRGGVRCYHLPQPVLDAPGKSCQLKNMGGGVSLPDRTKSPDDIAPLFACAMAYAAATRPVQKEKRVYESSYAAGSSPVFV
ncbi:MAG: hypothetical protein HUJ67_07530 [Ruminiclostridium sp.]|nr:hypothetical protein [Ruminiclostridium sp.]